MAKHLQLCCGRHSIDEALDTLTNIPQDQRTFNKFRSSTQKFQEVRPFVLQFVIRDPLARCNFRVSVTNVL